MVVEYFYTQFIKVTDIVQVRILSGNKCVLVQIQYVHVQVHVLFSGWRSRSLGLLMIVKTNVMQIQIFLRISEVVCA